MENTEGNGGPQADFVGEREVPGINRKLKKKNIYPQMTHMDTDRGPQADFVGERGLINDDWWMMTDDLMDYILSGYKLYENKGETWKYGQVLTKIQNKIVSLQRICDESG